MKTKLKAVALMLMFFAIFGCTRKSSPHEHVSAETFPDVSKLSTYKETVFNPTLEHPIPESKNVVYAASLLFAWDQIRSTLQQPLQIDPALTDLTLLNNSKSYIDTLDKSELQIKTEITESKIKASAEFSKTLPFKLKLEEFPKGLFFKDQLVDAYGARGNELPSTQFLGIKDKASEVIEILYYKDNDDFILKLRPKDETNEIILYTTTTVFNTMAQMISSISSKIELGKKESRSSASAWKYRLTEDDLVKIPKFKFNIEHSYSTLEGNRFNVNPQLEITTAYQRTAFLLDQEGTKVESKAEETVEVAAAVPGNSEAVEEKPRPVPKYMTFDRPFFLMLKKVDRDYPYFGLWVANTELMDAKKPPNE